MAAPSAGAEHVQIPDILETLCAKIDSLDKQIREQGAEQHFQIRRLEKMLGERMDRLLLGGGDEESGRAPAAAAVSPRWASALSALRAGRGTDLSTGRRTGGQPSYIDTLVEKRMSRISTNDSSSKRESGGDQSEPAASWPVATTSSPMPEEPNAPAAAPARRSFSWMTGPSRKGRLMQELQQREPRRGSLAAAGRDLSAGRRQSPNPGHVSEAAVAAVAAADAG